MSRKPNNPDANYYKQMLQAERSILEFTLQNADNMAHAARILGLTDSYFYKRLEKVGLLAEAKKYKKTKVKPRMIAFPVRVIPSPPTKVSNPVTIKLKNYSMQEDNHAESSEAPNLDDDQPAETQDRNRPSRTL